MTTYMVQIQLGSDFRDVYVNAKDENAALSAARSVATKQELKWAAFVI